MAEILTERIERALAGVRSARHAASVIEAEMIRGIATTPAGRVRLTLLLSPDDDATLVRDVRQAVEAVDGVTDVRVDIQEVDPAQPPAPQGAPAGRSEPGRPARSSGRALPMLESAPPPAPRPSAPTPVAYPNLGRVIAVSSGKGGVGKSTVATNLAIALAQRGLRVGLMDADIYGPNIPRMMGAAAPPPVVNDRIVPLEAHGVKLISLGLLVDREQPAIWRGPIIMKIIVQFLRDVAWGTLDTLIVDMPPGTGDAQLSLVQATQLHSAVIVTTPQEVSIGDALRGAMMFRRVGVPVLGIVENMSTFACPHCGEETPLFGVGGGARLAAELGLPLLVQIPLYAPVLREADAGRPIIIAEPNSAPANALRRLGELVVQGWDAKPGAASRV